MRARSAGCVVGLACALLASSCTRPNAGLSSVPAASQRFVTLPCSVAALSQTRDFIGLPSQVSFGDARGRSALYLRFAPEWRAHGAPLRGFIALEPRAGATPDATPVTVEVWRVHAPWQAGTLHAWSDKPELAPPFARAIVIASPARQVRIDITELLRFAAQHPETDYGFALIARGGSGHGVTVSTGMNGGNAPRLEVYAR